MGVQGTSAFKALVAEMGREWGHGFQRLVHARLTEIWPDLVYAPDLVSDLDRAGVDLYRGSQPAFEMVVQCKGTKAPIDRTHLPQIERSVQRFLASSLEAEEYWLILNHPIPDPDLRREIDLLLTPLLVASRVSSARWLDPNALLRILFERLRSQFREELPLRNVTRLLSYAAQMRAGRAYVADVPFTRYVRTGRGSRGTAKPATWTYVSEQVRDPYLRLYNDLVATLPERRERTRATNGSAYRFVLSDFGFGKTSLLLQLGATLPAPVRPALYVPVVELSSHAFATEHNFVSAVFALLYPEHAPHVGNARYIPLQIFRWCLRSDPNFVLLLDGLDENRLAYSTDGLTRLFRAMRDLACDVVVSARKEFWETSRGNLELAMKEVDNDREFYVLSDWDEQSMLAYLREFPPTPTRDFVQTVIAQGRYPEVYGDIPRRPLFLEMLVEDTDTGPAGPVSVLALYTHCLERKLDRDIRSPFTPAEGLARPLPTNDMDLLDLRRRVFALLVELAGRMATPKLAPDTTVILTLEESAPEAVLLEAATQVGLPAERAVYLLLHSILSPSGTEGARGPMLFRFAHRSYHEYFLAHYVRDHSELFRMRLPPLVQQFLSELRGLDEEHAEHPDAETFLV